MSLKESREAIRPLLNPRDPGDAAAIYYAFHHPEEKTRLVTYPAGARRASGYVAISRTGIDLFRPFVTLRLPQDDLHTSVELVGQALPVGAPAIILSPAEYGPLLRALFDISVEEHYRLFILDPGRFEPIINVLVSQNSGPNGLPRFVVRSPAQDMAIVAAAGLNWQTPDFAEIAVTTGAGQRRQGWGRSVVAAMVQYLQASGRTPLYLAGEENEASLQLARSVGFVDTGLSRLLWQASRKALP